MLIASLIRHARAQFRAKLARHRPRLLTLLGLAAEARGEAQAEGGRCGLGRTRHRKRNTHCFAIA